MAIGRIDPARLGEIAADLRHANHRGAGQGHVDLAVEQCPAGEMHRHQRGRAGCLYIDRGAGQVELEGYPRGQEVPIVAEMAEIAGLTAQFGMVVPQRIARHQPAGAHIGAHHALAAERIVAGILERLPGGFEKQPLLWVHQPRLARGVAEKSRVEAVVIGDDRRGLDVMRVSDQLLGDPGGQQLFVGEAGDRFDAAEQIAPERRRGRGAGKPAGDADDGDVAKARAQHHAVRHHAGPMKSR